MTANVSLRKGYDAGYLNAGHGTGGCAGAGPGGLAVDACGLAEEQQLEKWSQAAATAWWRGAAERAGSGEEPEAGERRLGWGCLPVALHRQLTDTGAIPEEVASRFAVMAAAMLIEVCGGKAHARQLEAR